MWRLTALVLITSLLAGCGGKSTITRYDKDGRIVSVEELTIDGSHAMYQAQALEAWAQPVDCEKLGIGETACVGVNMGRDIVVASGAVKIQRGMTDNEAIVAGLREAKEALPAAGLLSAVRYISKRPNSVAFNGDGNAYLSSDPVGQGNIVTAPLFSPPTTTTTMPAE